MKKLFLICLFLLQLLAGCSKTLNVLPRSLYFLDGPKDSKQVWRLEKDGKTFSQITFEEKGVENFDVSSVDGSTALISDNKLFLVDPKSQNHRLIVDGNLVEAEGEEWYFKNSINNPSFSPDGHTLAYGLDGLHLYNLSSGENDHVLSNLGNLMGEPFVYAKEVYSPGPWSPDGSMLLFTMSYYEGFTLAVMNPGVKDSFVRLLSDGALCCLISWTSDSQSILVANPYFTGTLPGLWKFDAHSGQQTTLVSGHIEDRSVNFVGWPYQSSKGDLFFFHLLFDWFSIDQGIPLFLVKSDENGSNMKKILPDEFRISDAVWSPDGSIVVVVGRYGSTEDQLFIVYPETGDIQVLIEHGNLIRALTWGP